MPLIKRRLKKSRPSAPAERVSEKSWTASDYSIGGGQYSGSHVEEIHARPIPYQSSRQELQLRPQEQQQQQLSQRDKAVLQTINRGFDKLGDVMFRTIANGHAGSFEINEERNGIRFKAERVCFAGGEFIGTEQHWSKLTICQLF